MITRHVYVADETVMEFFTGRNRRERDELLRVFQLLAESPFQKDDWRQRTTSRRELHVRRFGKWLVSFWLDDPVLEVRVVDVKKIGP